MVKRQSQKGSLVKFQVSMSIKLIFRLCFSKSEKINAARIGAI